MEIKNMSIAEIEARLAEMKAQIESAESEEQLNEMKEAFTEERKLLSERKAELVELETRKAEAKAITEGTMVPKVIEERKEETNMKKVEEYRNSKEYIDAFAEFLKTGKPDECRALLTTNVGEAGEVAIPDMVSDIIKTDWVQSELLGLVKTIEVPGNYIQQFEVSAGDAVIHDEGSGAVSEEELSLGIVKLIPESIKKWISISDEVMDMKGQAFLEYVVKELSYKISVKTEDVLIDKIVALPTSATATTVNAKVVKAGAAVTTIATALGELNAEAKNPVAIMHPSTKAAYVAAARTANFAMDPFEGLKVILTNNLPAIGSASENDCYAIVGDVGFGALANFPNGKKITIKVDDKTKMTEDLVRVLGREYIAIEPVACRAFVKITKPAAV